MNEAEDRSNVMRIDQILSGDSGRRAVEAKRTVGSVRGIR